jgi:ketosteroid isomerase-like protein
MPRVSEAHEVQAKPDPVTAADAASGAVVTRIASARAPRRSRSIDERLIVRFPSVFQVSAALIKRLRPEAWVRRRFVCHGVVSGWAGVQRRDFELVLVRYAPDVVFEADASLQALGVPGSARGREEMAQVVADLLDAWDRLENAPAAIVDLGGESLIVLGVCRMHGPRSGIELETEVAQLVTFRAGLVARERQFYRWDDALRAAGLDPAALDLPPRR